MDATQTGSMGIDTISLQRYQSFEIHAARLLGGWMPGIIRWEMKHQLGIHLWEDAQHSRDLRTRLWELRVPDPDRNVTEQILPLIDRLAQAQHDYELLAGVYLGLKSELLVAYKQHVDATHHVYDAPTIPMLRRIITEKEAQIVWAQAAVEELADSGEKQRRVKRWTEYVLDVLASVGGVNGATKEAGALPDPPPGYTLLLPFPEAKRDARFDVQLESGIHADEDDRLGQVLYQFANYGAEMQAAETLGSILWETEGMPWEFYYDVARHCHDEMRHSKLGEARLRELGYHLTDFPHSIANYAWRQLIDPLRRYCTLTYIIEADSFQYKHSTYQEHLANNDLKSAQAVLFDITDETMHVRWGKKWVPKLMEHYNYKDPLNELITECRNLTYKHSANPLQRNYASLSRA